MRARFLELYERELEHIRELAGEFAEENQKIAGRLGLDAIQNREQVTDPYVERLLEGFSYLAARVQLKLEAEYPRFMQSLFDSVCPQFLAPVPSMTIMQMTPDYEVGDLAEGITIPRNTRLRSQLISGHSSCEYRTAHPVTLWPLELTDAHYQDGMPQHLGELNYECQAWLRLNLRSKGPVLNELPMDDLVFHLPGEARALQIYEQLFARATAILVSAPQEPGKKLKVPAVIEANCIEQVGFSDDEALIPQSDRSFSGYRLLQEYFYFPKRFQFFRLTGLREALRKCAGTECEIHILFDREHEPLLPNRVSVDNFKLFCSPAINLVEKSAKRIEVNDRQTEFHVVPDPVRPLDFEVYSIQGVSGFTAAAEEKVPYLPFYGGEARDIARDSAAAYFTQFRRPRQLPQTGRLKRNQPNYRGSEVHLSIVNAFESPYCPDVKQLQVDALCTNRGLPEYLRAHNMDEFSIDTGDPVETVHSIVRPTAPRPALPEMKGIAGARQKSYGEITWRLVDHLTLNYASLQESTEEATSHLKRLLNLYAEVSGQGMDRQVHPGIDAVSTQPVLRRLPFTGPLSFGRGVEVTVKFRESAFAGSGIFILGAVLERFLARYVSINSFTETVIESERGEVMRWPLRIGLRKKL